MTHFKWIHLDYPNYQGQTGWLREDFTRLKGNFEQYGLAFHDMYPNPAQQSWWSRDFNMNPDFIPILHSGWDQAGEIGTPIIGGPKGGKVIRVAFCEKCEYGASAIDGGYKFNDDNVLTDPAWNYGYGHFVIVTYHNDKLPQSTQDRLSAQGKAGWHISALYSQLHTIAVEWNQELEANAFIGTLGNTGNSTGAHLGLEVHAHRAPYETQWEQLDGLEEIEDALMSPAILFLR